MALAYFLRHNHLMLVCSTSCALMACLAMQPYRYVGEDKTLEGVMQRTALSLLSSFNLFHGILPPIMTAMTCPLTRAICLAFPLCLKRTCSRSQGSAPQMVSVCLSLQSSNGSHGSLSAIPCSRCYNGFEAAVFRQEQGCGSSAGFAGSFCGRTAMGGRVWQSSAMDYQYRTLQQVPTNISVVALEETIKMHFGIL